MRNLKPVHVEVYVFRRRGRAVEFLCLKRSAGRSLAGVWQPVTGKRRWRERAGDAARREVIEETGAKPLRMWALETVTVFYDGASNTTHALPLFAAELRRADRIRLSREHDDYRFTSAARAGKLYLWESQRRGLQAVRREVLASARLAKALEMKPSRGKRG